MTKPELSDRKRNLFEMIKPKKFSHQGSGLIFRTENNSWHTIDTR